MQKLITLTLALFFFVGAFAQYPGAGGPPKIGILEGSVVDEATNEPIAYATITIRNAKDSTVVTGGLSLDDGTFSVNEIPLGGHFAEISFIGYEKQIRGPIIFNPQETVKHNIGSITLSASAAQIEDVTIEGAAAPVRYEVDKKIYDASQIKAAEGGNAKDVLQQIPSVTVDDQGNIQLRGSQNVRVLINGRPSSFSLQTLLEQIPQKNIQDIEIITNPSAKYDAEGEAGIINIVLKENDIEGFTGNVGANWGTENKYNGNVGLNLKTKKWNLSSSFNLNRFEDDFLRDNQRNDFINAIGVDQISDEDRDFYRKGQFARIGIDHYLNESSTVFFSASLNPGDGENVSLTANDNVFFAPVEGVTNYNRFNDGFNDRTGGEVTLGLQKEFDGNPKHNLLLDAAYNVGEEQTTNNRSNVFFDPLELIFNSFDTDITDNDRNTTTLSLDYTNPFSGKEKLELGFRAVLEDQEQRFQVFQDDAAFNSDDLFNFTQDVAAAYVTYEKNFEKLGLKGGLRSEFTDVDSEVENELGANNEYTDTYISLFPSATASYTLSESANMRLSYSRRINRPNGQQLTPFADRTDLNNLFEGNNTLRPEFTDSYEFGYSKFFDKMSVDASVYHRGITDHIRYFRDTVRADGGSTISFRNVNQLNVYGMESSFNFNPANWLNLMVSGNYNYGEIQNPEDEDGEVLNASTSIFSGRIMANMNFPKGWGGQVSSNYQSPFAYYQGRLSAMYGVDMNVRKSFMKGKLNSYIRVNDLFNTFGLEVEFEDDSQAQNLVLDWPSQMGFIGFNYNFGQMKQPAKRKQQRREERQERQPGLGF